jgi:hypothetical protein
VAEAAFLCLGKARIHFRSGQILAETDLTYEDTRQLIGERVGDFEYRMTGRSGSGWTIEATAKPGVETAYGKRVIAIHRQNEYVPLC